MNTPVERDALRAIQDIVLEEKGSPLEREGVRALESVLRGVTGHDRAARNGYSRREATILFADVRGFSSIASAHPPQVVFEALNRCFSVMADIVTRHYGTVDKFIGDAIMAVFHGNPGTPWDHARRAVLCAVEMQVAMKALHELGEREPFELYLGIGISSGNVMAGLIGSDAYRAYTVIGDEVNVAARIEALSLRGQVLMSEATYAYVKDFVRAGDPIEVAVKGRSKPLKVREAFGIPELGRIVPSRDARRSPRVPVRLHARYWPMQSKAVAGEAGKATVCDLSYHGLLAELAASVPCFSELKLEFDLPGERVVQVRDLYARVVSLREKDGTCLAGMEFTSLDSDLERHIRRFVQLAL